jgi:hypothetical protein
MRLKRGLTILPEENVLLKRPSAIPITRDVAIMSRPDQLASPSC